MNAYEAMTGMLARRDHSEKELRAKLKKREFSSEEIEKVVTFAKDKKWLKIPADLALTMAEALHRKNKGILYINHYLKEKGLPPISTDSEREFEKARCCLGLALRKSKRSREGIALHLKSRGFTLDIVRQVIQEIPFEHRKTSHKQRSS